MEHHSDEEPRVKFAPTYTNEVRLIPPDLSPQNVRSTPTKKKRKRGPRRSKSTSAHRFGGRRLKNEPNPDWLATLVNRHSCNITEDMREERRINEKRRRERQQRAALSARRAHTLCSLSSSSRAATFTSYRSLSTRLSTPVSARRSVQIQDDLHRHEESMNLLRDVISTPNLQTQEVAETVLSSLEVDQDISENEIDKLLRELRYKPKDDEEATSKFAMYEAYAKTVETTRGGLCEFWAECQESFDKRICASINNDITKLDAHQNMGIAWNERVWWAYEMIKVANQNNLKMISLLQNIQTKLELVAREDDCPICLEPKVEKHTLTCCHKVCCECWGEWQLLQGQNAFCPLCKEKDFIQAVLAAEEHPLYSAQSQEEDIIFAAQPLPLPDLNIQVTPANALDIPLPLAEVGPQPTLEHGLPVDSPADL